MASFGSCSAPRGVRHLQRPTDLRSGLPFGGDCPSPFTYREILEGVGGSNQRHDV